MTVDSVADAARFVLVADGGCGPCSSLGREVAGLADLDVISTARAKSLGWTDLAGKPSQAGPFLVQIQGDVPMARWYGWGMRLRLARLLGVRRAKHWLRLLHAEYRARDMRVGQGVSRRTVVLGALAGVITAASSTQLAAADPRSEPDQYRPIDTAKAADLLAASPAARDIVDRLGAVEYGTIVDGEETIFAIQHSTQTFSVVLMSAPEVGTTISVKDQGKTVSLTLHTGEHLIDFVDLDTNPRAVKATPPQSSPPTTVATAFQLGSWGDEPVVTQPVGRQEFADCILLEAAWLNATAVADCIDKCLAGGVWCAFCLGKNTAFAVAKCFPKLFS
ncbi:hypothetical protein [Microlunatus sp. GCM10028923]|uniref:hypothetical protein n=1 Tax=Microlunatus sp. GCM10028923 TaxID=3273400 RepID=UPI003618D3EC